MTFLNAMPIKNLKLNSRPSTKVRSSGFTLLETLIATGIASVIITSALSVVASIYFSQKKVQFSHDFFSEARFLMERISQVARNNTIDYDRYFVEYGPSNADCPTGFRTGNGGQTPLGHTTSDPRDKTNRANLGYSTIFYWDTNSDGVPDRNLGGMVLNGSTEDDCTKAFNETDDISRLFLINSSRTMRVEIRHEPAPEFKVSMSRQLGADTDGDGLADTWGPTDMNSDGDIEAGDLDVDIVWTGAECQLLVNENSDTDYNDPNEIFPVLGDATTESWCDQAHIKQDISPVALQLDDLSFTPVPVYDPYLAFRNDKAQVHPQVFINMNISLRNPDRYGFEGVNTPTLSFQTAVSSRVFGNIRR
jgi:type II secretory pathway pseudopilin PulG